MADETKRPTLRCSKCDLEATGDLAKIARPGGTHYATKTREKEARKTEGRFVRATTCGTWTEVTVAAETCQFVADDHVMPGWGCCRCRSYNGLQRTHCRRCDHEHEPLAIPDNVSRCPGCGFGWIGEPDWIHTAEPRDIRGVCPSCGVTIATVKIAPAGAAQ